MAVLVVVCFMVWSGMLPFYDPGFSSASDEEPPLVQPCPPADATTTDVGGITVNVYNGTDTTGLATGLADTLKDSGLNVTTTSDWPKGEYAGEIQLTTSPAGLANAYTLAQVFTGAAIVQIDETQDPSDPAVGVVLGEGYTDGMLTAAEIAQIKPGTHISAPDTCEPVASATSGSDGSGDSGGADSSDTSGDTTDTTTDG